MKVFDIAIICPAASCDVVNAPAISPGETRLRKLGYEERCPGLSFRGISLSGKMSANLWSSCQNSANNAWNMNNNGNTNNNNKYNQLLVVPLAELSKYPNNHHARHV